MPSYIKPLYNNLNFYNSRNALLSIDTTHLLSGTEVFVSEPSVAYSLVYKLFKNDPSLSATALAYPTVVAPAPNGSDFWVAQDPLIFYNAGSGLPIPQECQYNPLIPVLSYTGTSPSTNKLDINFLQVTPTPTTNYINSWGSATGNASGSTNSLIIYDSRFTLGQTIIFQVAACQNNYLSFTNLNTYNNYAVLTFIQNPGLVTVNYVGLLATPT